MRRRAIALLAGTSIEITWVGSAVVDLKPAEDIALIADQYLNL